MSEKQYLVGYLSMLKRELLLHVLLVELELMDRGG